MKKVEIISKLPTVFVRTLEEGQELCPECGGIQLVSDGKYITSCKSCIGRKGVVDRCSYCGELAIYNHNCKGKRDAEYIERCNKESEKWNKVKKITLDEAIDKFVFFYIDNTEDYIEADCLMEWIEDKEADDEEFNRETLHVYGTYKTQIGFDAANIVESACDDLHEEAGDSIGSEAIKELQSYLDDWAEKYGSGTTTYNADMQIGIIIP